MLLLKTVLHRKRGVILFIIAFLLPLVFVAVAGYDTFSKRQETTRNLLESNLWLSGRSALELFEKRFNEIESEWLNADNFNTLRAEAANTTVSKSPVPFLLNIKFKIIYPKHKETGTHSLLFPDRNWNSGYRNNYERAKVTELTGQNYLAAIDLYKTCLKQAETNQQEALAIEGMARSFLALNDYNKALAYYQLLYKKYNQTVNLGGHPYGITAALQMYGIGLTSGESSFNKDSLNFTYRLLKDKHWLINSASYFFFKEEFDSILNSSTESPVSEFEHQLSIYNFLMDFVLPSIRERTGFTELNNGNLPKRIYLPSGDSQYLVSYIHIPDSDSLQDCIGGIYWDLDSITAGIAPVLLRDLSNETGLEFQLIDNKKLNIVSGLPASVSKEYITLKFDRIPLPWSLVAIQPGYEKLESDAQVQVIIYGTLLLIIIALMVFAVVILLRDISRETDTMLLQTEFVHNVSHELKTPLSLIRLYGETLLYKENLSNEDRKEGLQIITKESERLSHMINNILDFSKIEMGRKEFDMKPGKIAEVVKNTLDSYRYHLLKKGFRIEEEIDHDIPDVPFDRNALEGILINLFSNAIKFSDKVKNLRIRLNRYQDHLLMEVTDKGIGIPPGELQNIFNRFYRIKGRSDFESRGSGLGLTLVKHTVDAHGWQIEVKSKPDEGSSFIITIPLKKTS